MTRKRQYGERIVLHSLKKERIRKRIYHTLDLTRADIFDYFDYFDYVEAFYNRVRRHSNLGSVSPEAFG